MNGKICYLQIPTEDVPRSAEFYKTIFGWDIRQRGDGATAFDDATGQVSGAFVQGRPPSPTPGLLVYIMVDSLVETIDRIKAAGMKIVQPPGMDGRELTARFEDPGGNVIGIYQEAVASSG